MALQEDKKTNKWKKQDICVGSTTACAFPGMISSHSKFIISFAKDEAGGYRAGHTFNGNCTVCSLLYGKCGKFCGSWGVPGEQRGLWLAEHGGWSVTQRGLLPCEAVADQVDEKLRKPNLMWNFPFIVGLLYSFTNQKTISMQFTFSLYHPILTWVLRAPLNFSCFRSINSSVVIIQLFNIYSKITQLLL